MRTCPRSRLIERLRRSATCLPPLLLALATATHLAACASGGPAENRAAQAPSAEAVISLLEERLDAIPGRTLVTPVAAVSEDPPDAVRLTLDTGASLTATLWFLAPDVAPAAPPNAAPWLARWLPGVREWSATRPSELPAGADNGPGFYALLIDLPTDTRARRILFREQSASIGWLEAPEARFAPQARRFERTPEQAAMITAVLQRLSSDPFQAWRARLAAERLGLSVSLAPIGDPVARALAEQIAARWEVGLARVGQRDAALAADVVDELTTLVRFSGGVAAPAWAPTQPAAQALLNDLLDPAGQRGALLAARSWLAIQPPAIAWVIDDGGAPPRDATIFEPPQVALLVAGIADRTGEAARVARLRAVLPGPRVVTGPVSPLLPSEATTVVLSIPLEAPAPSVVAIAGGFEQSLRVFTRPTPARPPGLHVGPAFSDLTMTSWLSGQLMQAPALDETVGLLRPALNGPGWELYIECRSLPDLEAPRSDTLRIWLGPRGDGRAPIAIQAPLEATDGPTAAAGGARILREPDRWLAVIPIPEDTIGRDNVLRLAFERRIVTEPGVRRSAWPRPMLPWQEEPGRLAVDLGGWGDLSDD